MQSICLDQVTSVAVTSDNKYIISGSFDKSIKVFDFQANQEAQSKFTCYLTHSIIPHDIDLMISEKGKLSTPGSTEKSIKIFDLQTRQEEYSQRANPSHNTAILDPSVFSQELYFSKSLELPQLNNHFSL